MKSSLLRIEPIAIFLMIGSSRSEVTPCTYCGVTAMSSTTTPAALVLAAADMRASTATSSRRANRPPLIGSAR